MVRLGNAVTPASQVTAVVFSCLSLPFCGVFSPQHSLLMQARDRRQFVGLCGGFLVGWLFFF